jgi:hypothetical protein
LPARDRSRHPRPCHAPTRRRRPNANWGRDLARTTDFRSVFSEVAFKHLGAAKMDAIFPGYAGTPSNWIGVL